MVLHSSWGLLRDYAAVCDAFASEGFVAVAPDLFNGRTAVNWTQAERLAQESPSTALVPIAVDTVQWLLAQPDVVPKRVAMLGFSLGGATALRAAANGIGDVVVTFYGTPSLERVDGLKIPVLGHFAETDKYETASDIATLFDKLQYQGTWASMVIYPGTEHCFVEPSLDAYDKSSADIAWSSTLKFLRHYLNGADPFTDQQD